MAYTLEQYQEDQYALISGEYWDQVEEEERRREAAYEQWRADQEYREDQDREDLWMKYNPYTLNG